MQLFLRLEYGNIYKTSATFVYVMSGQSAEINISNVEVDEFYSGSPGGHVINEIELDSCHLSIKDSSFHNGRNYGAGGILFIGAKNAALTI